MNEPLEQGNLAKPSRLHRMVWLVSLTGVRWGGALGAAYIFFFYLAEILLGANTDITEASIILAVGAVWGAVYGLVLGSLHGLILGRVTMLYFEPLNDERIYRRALAAISLLLSTGFGVLLEICYLALEDEGDLIVFLFLVGVPLIIATIACIIGSQRFAQWYSSGRFG